MLTKLQLPVITKELFIFQQTNVGIKLRFKSRKIQTLQKKLSKMFTQLIWKKNLEKKTPARCAVDAVDAVVNVENVSVK